MKSTTIFIHENNNNGKNNAIKKAWVYLFGTDQYVIFIDKAYHVCYIFARSWM
jgi:hypothetical protein